MDELVNFLNGIDTSYRSELKELIDLNFTRFDAKLEQRLAELKAELKAEMSARFAAVDSGSKRLRSEIAVARADNIKWTFFFVATGVLAILGLG